MKTFEITFSSGTAIYSGGGVTVQSPPKRVKADKVKYDKESNMILFIGGDKALSTGEETFYMVDRNAVLAVETF